MSNGMKINVPELQKRIVSPAMPSPSR